MNHPLPLWLGLFLMVALPAVLAIWLGLALWLGFRRARH